MRHDGQGRSVSRRKGSVVLKIALTGADGFTGVHFTSLAQAHGHEVLPLAADLTDAQALRAAVDATPADVVVHLAAIAFVGHGDERALYDVNLFGTLNLLNALAAAARPPRRVLVSSSANVYGNGGNVPMTEDTCPAPVNHYACSKLAMEYMARTFAARLALTLVRPFNYTGRGQSPQFVIPKLVDHFRRRAPSVRLGNLHVLREYNDVRFVCEAYLRLLTAPVTRQTLNVCTGRTWDLAGVIARLQSLTGHVIGVQRDPALVRPNEVHCLSGDPARLHAAIGELPAPPLEETLQWMLSQE